MFRLELLQRINDPIHSGDFTQHTVARYKILKLLQRIIITELIVKIIPDRRGNDKIIGNRGFFVIKHTEYRIRIIAAVIHRIVDGICQLMVDGFIRRQTIRQDPDISSRRIQLSSSQHALILFLIVFRILFRFRLFRTGLFFHIFRIQIAFCVLDLCCIFQQFRIRYIRKNSIQCFSRRF